MTALAAIMAKQQQAFVDGGEHVADLGRVNGGGFVNNVSMGLYAEAVQSKGYRDAKIRTLLDTVPAVFGPTGSELDLQWVAPDGAVHASAATILVSNNAYRLGHVVGSGRGLARGSIPAGSVSPWCPRGARTARAATLVRRYVSGRPPSSRSTRPTRSRWASTVRRSCSSRRSAFGYALARCGCGSRRGIRGRRPRRWSPTGWATACTRWPRSPPVGCRPPLMPVDRT